MNNEQRERLIELIGSKVCGEYSPNCDEYEPHSCEQCYANSCRIGELADHLLKHNVTVLPCKAGDTIYRIRSGTKEIVEEDVLSVHFHKTFATIFCFVKDEGIYSSVDFDDSGKNIFYTREEAEKALERSEEK